MSRLNMLDMNSLNAIAGSLRHTGNQGASEVLLSIQKKATELLDRQDVIVDMVFDLLDAYDINLWQDIAWVDLAEVWCDAVNENPDDDAIKVKLKEFLFGKEHV